MTLRLSRGPAADAWFADPRSEPYRVAVSDWLAELCDDPPSKASSPAPGLPTPARIAFVETIIESSILVTFTVVEEENALRVHKILGSWQVPMM